MDTNQNSAEIQQNTPEKKGAMGMVRRAFGDRGSEFVRTKVEGIVDSEPVQEAGARIIQRETKAFVNETLPNELRTAANEAEGLGPSYEVIRESITVPEDGFLKRIFKSFVARALAAGVKISSLVGGSVLSDYTTEDEEEKKKYAYYLERAMMGLFRDRIKPSMAA